MANRLLGLFLSSLAIANISFLLYRFETPPVIHLLKVHLPVEFLIPPFVFLYFRTIIDREQHLKKRDWLHFIPAVYFFIDNFSFYFQSSSEKLEWFINRHLAPTHHHLFATMFYLQFAIYLGFIIRKLVIYNKNTEAYETYSKVIIKWAKETLAIILGILLVNILPVFSNVVSFLFVPILSSVLYFFILYKAFFEPDIFTLKVKNSTNEAGAPKTEFETESNLNKLLMDVITNKKIYKNPDVNLPGLADAIEIPYHQLSRFINKKYNQNFNDFINSKRVEDVKELLLNSQYKHLTIEAIGRSAGFNSKAAFYNAFKKFENCSPTQFKKAMQAS